VSAFVTVLTKECRDNIRDRRTIISSFSVAVLGPALFVALMAFVLDTAVGESSEPIQLTIVGSANAPQMVDYLETQNTVVDKVELDDPRQAVVDGLHSLVLVIPADYAKRFNSGEINSVSLIYDSSDIGKARRNFMMARQFVSSYGRTIGLLRLQLRGVDPGIATPIQVQEVDTASPAARALTILATLPYLLVLVIFMGGFYLAIDATAGEREHGSLEPLLTQPVSRVQLVLGKVAATSVFSGASLALFLASLALSLPHAPLHKVGMSLHIDALTALGVFLVSLPLIAFAAALLNVVASFAKSYKEAQTYLTFVILIPTLPLIITRLLNVESSAALMLIPSLSQGTLINDLIAGEPVDWTYLLISVVATSVLAGLMTLLAVLLYRRERILI
jgi:sodium transport system permease protein